VSTADDATLDSCNCCDVPADPVIDNLPGQPAIAFRVATYASLLEDMKAQLARQTIPSGPNAGTRPLAPLTTRDGDDATIALADATAVVGEILTFYAERIANEGYLRTATERRSVLELARAIGYELNPGVAASGYLAFVIDAPFQPPLPAPAAPQPPSASPSLPAAPASFPTPSTVDLPAGTKVQSVPGQGQTPQTFETSADLEARVSWNALKARTQQPQFLGVSGHFVERLDLAQKKAWLTDTLYLEGTATNLRPGDPLIVLAFKKATVVFVTSVTPDFQLMRSTVTFSLPAKLTADPEPTFEPIKRKAGVADTAPLTQTIEHVRDKIFNATWDEVELQAYLAIQRWDADKLTAQVQNLLAAEPRLARVFALRSRNGFFGHSAPPWIGINQVNTNPWKNWESANILETGFGGKITTYIKAGYNADVFLDRVMSTVTKGSWVAFAAPGLPVRPFLVSGVTEASLADFAISGKATGLLLEEPSGAPAFALWDYPLRKTSAYVQSEELLVAHAPITTPLRDDTGAPITSVQLDRMVLGIAAGQVLLVSGVTVDANDKSTGATANELATVQDVTHTLGFTTITFQSALANVYLRDQLVISANVALATHGDTGSPEILGSGDGSQTNQRFALKRSPLTYVSAPTASGSSSALTVRVGGVEWSEAPSLYGLGPTSQSYTLRTDDSGITWVIFGDGVNGARLPTGTANVTATYRVGLGPAGEQGAGQLTLLQSRPLGVRGVTNPLPATGSAPPEALDDARSNAPRTVLTLDRVVSLDDFEDFTAAFAGIGKAQSVPLWSGESQVVHLTVGSATGGAVTPDMPLYQNLIAAIAASSDGAHRVLVDSFQPRFFKLSMSVWIDPRMVTADVLAAATTALEAAFTFETRDFGQSVSEAELLALVQGVSGVVACRVDALYAAGATPTTTSLLTALTAQWDATHSKILPAELLLLQPGGLTLTPIEPQA